MNHESTCGLAKDGATTSQIPRRDSNPQSGAMPLFQLSYLVCLLVDKCCIWYSVNYFDLVVNLGARIKSDISIRGYEPSNENTKYEPNDHTIGYCNFFVWIHIVFIWLRLGVEVGASSG